MMKWMRRMAAVCLMALMMILGAGAEESGITLKLIPREEPRYTNALFHYVYFDAEVNGAKNLTLRVLNPSGEPVGFRTRRHVDQNKGPVNNSSITLRRGQTRAEGLNVLFPSESQAGKWTIEVTAAGDKKQSVTERLQVEITNPAPLKMSRLAEVHAMLNGMEADEPQPVYLGSIRYISQDAKEPHFVKEYWFSSAFDLRPTANQKCTRAVFSMALSWLGIDCTPINMSEILRTQELDYTYDKVCRKLGNVERVKGDLESLWADYEAGEGSPVLLHFKYDEGMHAVLLVARDEEEKELFYGVTSGQRINTSAYPDGQTHDAVIPIRIEKGETGQRIQSPMLERYHRAVIDEIWQWKLTDEH